MNIHVLRCCMLETVIVRIESVGFSLVPFLIITVTLTFFEFDVVFMLVVSIYKLQIASTNLNV